MVTDQNSVDLMTSSPLAWVELNNLVTENQEPIEFVDHRFLIDLYTDLHPDIVVKKSAQVGESVERIIKSIWCAYYLKANIIYVLPTRKVVDDFVVPKVNPLVTSNPVIARMVSADTKSLKQVGDRFIYFNGAYSESEAIMKSADILVLDELDRMDNPAVVNMFDSRLQASKLGWRWKLSNPSGIGQGVDALFQDSDQRHWFITCNHCRYEWYIDWERDGRCHYVDRERQIYACGKCGGEISDNARRMGRWVARFPGHYRHGYWISQMMAPWVSAKRIIEQYEESTIDFFYNFVLGKAYTASDLIVNRETILRSNAPGTIPRTHVAIGVDQNVSEQIWVAATPQGIFAHGKASSWEEIEHMKLMWNAVVVCDPQPYPTQPKKYADKYTDWYLCYFKEIKGLDILKWKGQVVYADRTRLLDTVANEITEARLLHRERPDQLEDLIGDWQNLYRTTVSEADGRTSSRWLKKDNHESDFPFATAYCRIGLGRVMASGDSSFIEPMAIQSAHVTDTISTDGSYETTLTQSIRETLEMLD